MATAVFEVRVEPLGGALPVVTWRLDEETEILAGGFKVPSRGQPGVSASVELTDPEGAIVVLDIHSGRLTGLDIVIWPAVELHTAMTPPVPARDAEILWPARPAPADSTAALEIETGLSATINGAGTVLHLALGATRAVETVRIGDHLMVDVDSRQRLAGFWLLDLPPLDLQSLDENEL
jgi:hypothetical protein